MKKLVSRTGIRFVIIRCAEGPGWTRLDQVSAGRSRSEQAARGSDGAALCPRDQKLRSLFGSSRATVKTEAAVE